MFAFAQQNAVEPMQVDAPNEDNDNTEEEPYIVENPTLVCHLFLIYYKDCHIYIYSYFFSFFL